MQTPIAPYSPRNPRLSDYYRCVEDFFEELERVVSVDTQIIEY